MTTPVPVTTRTGMFRGNSVDPQSVLDLQGLITQAATQVTTCNTQATAAAASAASALTQLGNVNAAATSGVANINAAVASGQATVNAAAAGVNSSVTTAVSSATAASNSKSDAAASATAAATSASAASTSATNAANSATGAAGSATAASGSATAAANSATNAANAAALLASSSNIPYNSTPAMDGAGAVGTSGNYARGDHQHPSDTSRAPVANAGLTGSTTAVNLAVSSTLTLGGVNVATTAQLPTAYASTPAMNGTASAGSATTWAKGDHVHPSDTSRAPLASPVFTGTAGVNGNAAAIPTGTSGTTSYLTLNGADTALPALAINSFGSNGGVFLRRANNTGAAPAALAANDTISRVSAGGHDGTAFSSPQGEMRIAASAAWTASSHPTHVALHNTSVGSTALTERVRLYPSGNLAVQPAGGTFTDDGVNALQVTGAAKVTGAATFGSTVALSADPVTALQASTKQYVDNQITARAVSFRNALFNSRFLINQRNPGAITANGGYVADRWAHFDDTTGSRALSLIAASDTDRSVIGDEDARAYVAISTNGGSGTGAFDLIAQRIEGVRTFAGKTITVSFWASATAGSSIGVEMLQSFGTGGSPSTSVTAIGATKVALTTSWVRYSVQIAVPSTAGKVIGTNGDDYLALHIWTSAGTTFATRSGSLGVQTGITTNLWGIQAEVGSVATPLEKVPMAVEMANCQRYYQPVLASTRFTATASIQVSDANVGWPAMRATPTAALVAAGTSSVASISGLFPYTGSGTGGRFEISSTASGDCYALNYVYSLTAEL